MIDSLNERLSGLQEEREDLEDQLGDTDIDQLEDKLSQVREKIKQRKETRGDLQEEAQTLRDERSTLENELSNLRELKQRIDEFERRAEWAKAVHDELNTTLNIYESVKSELREKYLAYINEYTNDIFQDIYLNSSYQRVVITETYKERSDSYDYDIQLLRDDGTTEDPSNASGGERAIVNLALRAGIYKLIAELEGGDRGRLPPFILDEPTTFLDQGHVGQLEQMLDRIRDWDVPQVIVVSHDEALIHGADHECYVEMDEATNTSRVTMRSAGAD
jgi:DNA repair exonuclease SbcCD ATPase subunit